MKEQTVELHNQAMHYICQQNIDKLADNLELGYERQMREDKLIKNMKKHFLKNIVKL